MRTKKTLLLVTALMLYVCTMQAQETNLLVHRNAGTPQSFVLSGIGKITFSESAANVLLKNGDSNTFPFASISKLTFSADGETGISPPDVSALKLYPNPVRDKLFVTSDTGIESITVFGLHGNVLLRSNVQSSSATLSLGFLPKGIYLIQTKRADAISTQKIIKQ